MRLLVSDWTPATLKAYFDSHLLAVHAEIRLRVEELHREHDKFEVTVKDGFVKQNEFRGSLEDLGRTMATRREMEAIEQTIGDRIETLIGQATLERGRLEDRVGKGERWQAKLGGGLLIIGLVLPSLMAIVVYVVTHHH